MENILNVDAKSRLSYLLLVLTASFIIISGAYYAKGVLFTPTNNLGLVDTQSAPVVVRISPAGEHYNDHEILQSEKKMVFQRGSDKSAWLANLDPVTGLFVSGHGRDVLVDSGLEPLSSAKNGPEFGVDKNGWAVFYSKKVGSFVQIWKAPIVDALVPPGKPAPLTKDTVTRINQLPSKNQNSESIKILYARAPNGVENTTGATISWLDENNPLKEATLVNFDPSTANFRWVTGESIIFTTIGEAASYGQVLMVNALTGERKVVTNDPGVKFDPYGWRAPEYNNELLAVARLTGSQEHSLVVYKDNGGAYWDRIATLTIPPDAGGRFLQSQEPFTAGGKSYISLTVKDKDLPITNITNGEIWIFGITENDRYTLRCDDRTANKVRTEAEAFLGTDEVFIYYSLLTGSNIEIHLCKPGISVHEDLSYKPGTYTESIVVDGRTRIYDLHIPTSFKSTVQTPLVLVLHGGGAGGRKSIETITGFTPKADKENFIVVYPEGVEVKQEKQLRGETSTFTWADGRNFGEPEEVNDVKFLTTLVEHLAATLPIDTKKVYVTGGSNGGNMAYRLGCESSNVFAAIAPVVGSFSTSVYDSCKSKQFSIPMLNIQSFDDPLMPFAGGCKDFGQGYTCVVGAEKSHDLIAEKNGCGLTPTVEKLIPQVKDGTRFEKWVYPGCKNGQDLTAFVGYGYGHTWPPSEAQSSVIAGKTSQNLNATDEIWAFFKTHALMCKNNDCNNDTIPDNLSISSTFWKSLTIKTIAQTPATLGNITQYWNGSKHVASVDNGGFVLSLSGSDCTDPDSRNVRTTNETYNISGVVKMGSPAMAIADVCVGQEILEYWCNGGEGSGAKEIKSIRTKCSSGCQNGACYTSSTVAVTSNSVSDPTTNVPPSNSVVSAFSRIRSLSLGTTHRAVLRLQQLLNSNPGTQVASVGPGSPGNETTYFGQLTMRAVQKFQQIHDIVSSGTPESTGFGRVGPRTRAKLQEVFGE